MYVCTVCTSLHLIVTQLVDTGLIRRGGYLLQCVKNVASVLADYQHQVGTICDMRHYARRDTLNTGHQLNQEPQG